MPTFVIFFRILFFATVHSALYVVLRISEFVFIRFCVQDLQRARIARGNSLASAALVKIWPQNPLVTKLGSRSS